MLIKTSYFTYLLISPCDDDDAAINAAMFQRQLLRSVAVSECCYSWNNLDGQFWVYGKEMAVYAPHYPQKYCWGCVIL